MYVGILYSEKEWQNELAIHVIYSDTKHKKNSPNGCERQLFHNRMHS